MKRELIKKHVLGLVYFFAGVCVTLLFHAHSASEPSLAVREVSDDYRFIAPLLLCRDGENASFQEFAPLKNKLERITDAAEREGTITSSSIYFRDLTKATWMGINEDREYMPASLLKVPIMIAYLKGAEKDRSLLARQVLYTQKPGQAPPLVVEPLLKSGYTYSVEQLIRGMIVDSDNTAAVLLDGEMDKKFLSEVYTELGVESPYSHGGEYRISTRTYGLFFRLLYNSTFLTREMSEKALSILSQTVFNKGLRAGVPADVSVAHKYGYAIVQKTPSLVELSDCGIVYKKGAPYILCVMAQGSEPEAVSTYIRDISSATYEEVAEGAAGAAR